MHRKTNLTALENDDYNKITDAGPDGTILVPKKKKFEPIYSLSQLILLGLGNTIGSGFFTLIGLAAKSAGPAVFISYLMSGFIALMTASVYAEFAGMIPRAGSSYLYSYTIFGELPAWIVGWNQHLRYGGCAATQSRAFHAFLVNFFVEIGVNLPKWIVTLKIFGVSGSPIAIIYLVICNYIATTGAKEAGLFNSIVTSLKLCLLGLIVIASFTTFDLANFTPFMDEKKGFSGIVESSTILFFSFLGFDFLTTLSPEAINPARNIPLAIEISVVLTALIYSGMAFALNGVGNISKLG